VYQVGFSLHDFIEKHGQQNIKFLSDARLKLTRQISPSSISI